MKSSQTAIEYLMTYWWALLAMVVIAGTLYALGIFNPSSTVMASVSGFGGLGSVSALCASNGVLRLQIGNTVSYTINVTNITASAGGKTVWFAPNSTIDSGVQISQGNSYTFSVPGACPAAGSGFQMSVGVEYEEIYSSFLVSDWSNGSITGTVSSTNAPLAVAAFNGAFTPYNQVNSQMSNINVGWTANQNYSISVWIDFASTVPNQSFVYITNSGTMSPLGLLSGKFWGSVWSLSDVLDSSPTRTGIWYNVVLSYDKATGINELYVDGASIGTSSGYISFPSQGASEILTLGYPNTGPSCIFSSSCTPGTGFSTIDGVVSNFQFYDSALASTQVSAIYAAGLAGKPVSGASLFLWWPLNGTAHDFSGNGNDGAESNVVFTSNYPTQ